MPHVHEHPIVRSPSLYASVCLLCGLRSSLLCSCFCPVPHLASTARVLLLASLAPEVLPSARLRRSGDTTQAPSTHFVDGHDAQPASHIEVLHEIGQAIRRTRATTEGTTASGGFMNLQRPAMPTFMILFGTFGHVAALCRPSYSHDQSLSSRYVIVLLSLIVLNPPVLGQTYFTGIWRG